MSDGVVSYKVKVHGKNVAKSMTVDTLESAKNVTQAILRGEVVVAADALIAFNPVDLVYIETVRADAVDA